MGVLSFREMGLETGIETFSFFFPASLENTHDYTGDSEKNRGSPDMGWRGDSVGDSGGDR